MDFNNTYTPFDFNQSTINSINTLLNDFDPSNFNLDLTIDNKYHTIDEFNLHHKSIFQYGLNMININVRSYIFCVQIFFIINFFLNLF